MTDNVVPGSITDNYTSRNRVTRPPPCPHMAGPRSPFPLRYLDKAVGFLVPRSSASFPVPHPPFWFFVPPFFIPCSQIYHNFVKLMSLPLHQKFNYLSLYYISIDPFASGEGKIQTHCAARILWVSFWFMCLVIMTTYTGNLVAALATQHVELPFRTLEELADDKEYSLTFCKVMN